VTLMLVSKSIGLRVLGLGAFLISAEVSTSYKGVASGMYVCVELLILSSERMSWKRRGKYAAVGIRRIAPRVTWVRGYMRGRRGDCLPEEASRRVSQ